MTRDTLAAPNHRRATMLIADRIALAAALCLLSLPAVAQTSSGISIQQDGQVTTWDPGTGYSTGPQGTTSWDQSGGVYVAPPGQTGFQSWDGPAQVVVPPQGMPTILDAPAPE